MSNDINSLHRRFAQLLDAQEFVETDLDREVVERHLSRLADLDVISTGAISVFDMFKRDHIYWSPKFETVFGWDLDRIHSEGTKYSTSLLHPNDLFKLTEAGIYFTSLILRLPVEKRRDYKMIADYRVIGAEGKYVRVIEQQSLLEQDRHGNVWLALSLLDLSPYSDTETSFRCRMINFKDGSLYRFPPDTPANTDLLTLREKEILHLISKGLVSREIADLLFISVNTVNKHRQNIIEKLDVSNTSEAIRYALDIGVLSPSN